MGVVRLGVCVGGVYGAFLLWAIAQERLSAPFVSVGPTTSAKPHSTSAGDRFPSPLFLNYAQALASCLSAFSYLVFTAWRSGSLRERGLMDVLGLRLLRETRGKRETETPPSAISPPDSAAGNLEVIQKNRRFSHGNSSALAPVVMARWSSTQVEKGEDREGLGDRARDGDGNGTANGVLSGDQVGRGVTVGTKSNGGNDKNETKQGVPSGKTIWRKTLPALLLQVSTLQTIAGPIGFLALRHISFPTMVLGKSCKLIPVMLLNILIYRRRFSAHKYIVVALVTAGISIFMLLAPKKAGKGAGSDSAWGLSLLLFNLFVDGLTNSTQDQIFTLYPDYAGQQMMFHMSLLAQLILLPLMLLPLPSSLPSLLHHLPIPLATHLLPSVASAPITLSPPAFLTSTSFLFSHPTAVPPLLAYALLGGLGQLFIFETIQHFGSLTLTMVTVTRKLFTMLLSVLVFEHKLTPGQWTGVAIVFAGIGVEAGVKRRDVLKKARRD